MAGGADFAAVVSVREVTGYDCCSPERSGPPLFSGYLQGWARADVDAVLSAEQRWELIDRMLAWSLWMGCATLVLWLVALAGLLLR